MESARLGTVVWLLAPIVAVGVSGCSEESRPPVELVDGTRAVAPFVPVEAPMPQIRTRVSAVPLHHARASTPAGRCLAAARDHSPTGPLVVRVGVSGMSVTFGTASGDALVACDGMDMTGDPWCGRSYGRLEHGRLHDARLDLGCTTASGGPLAFAWFEPGRETSYVAVRQRGYVEVYRVAGREPVRISTTTGISETDSSARFDISEHDHRGLLLRKSELEARVAG